MKTRRFLIAAVSGVLCGLTVQFVKHSRKTASATFSVNSLITDSAFVSGFVADDGFESLEARLARYSSEPPPRPVPSGSHESRTTVDRLLRMLLLPVTGESIAEGVAALNVAGESSYSSSESAIFCRWAEVAPEAALAAVDMIRAPETKSLLLLEVFRHYGAENTAMALSKAGNLPAGMLRTSALVGIANALTPDQVPETLRGLMRNQTPDAQNTGADSFEKIVVKRWIKSDPQAALEFVTGLDDPVWRTELLKSALFDIRLPSFMTQGPGIKKEDLLKLAHDPRNMDGIREEIVELIRPVKENIDRILSALPSDADRRAVTVQAIKMTLPSSENIDPLAAKFSEAGRTGEFVSALQSAALEGDSGGLAKTAQWLTQHSPSGLDELTTQASRTIPFATARWLTTLPPSPGRNHAVGIFAKIHASVDPERAADWAESITNPGERSAVMNAIRSQAESGQP